MMWQQNTSAAAGVARLGIGDLVGFFAFSHGWTWLFWAIAALVGASVWEMPGTIFFYIGGVGVMLGGIVMCRVVYGRGGIQELGRRIIDPRFIPGRWWAVVLLTFPALTLVAAAIAILVGASSEPLRLSGTWDLLARPLQLVAFVAFILIIGPLPEEIGWRGYLLDRLQLRWSALTASLLMAGVWWAWHLPLFVLPGYFDAFEHAPPGPLDLLYGLIPAAILYTWLYNNTNRSVLAVILFHLIQNLSGELLGISPEARQIQLILMVVMAIGVAFWWGPHTLRQNKPVPLPQHEVREA
jgi:membrane protease YdiL (CAAX protease family)